MRLLLEPEIRSYCREDGVAKRELRERIASSGGRPAAALTGFELCRALYYGAQRGLDVAQFRACWAELSEFCAESIARGEGGTLLFDTGDGRVARLLLAVPYDHGAGDGLDDICGEEVPDDRRDVPALHVAQARRFRAAYGVLAEDLQTRHGENLCWECEPLPVLPDAGRPALGNDLVLDANVLIDVLVALSVSALLPRKVGRVTAPTRERLQIALQSRDADRGQLLIPCVAFEEADRVARRKQKEGYGNVPGALRSILDPDSVHPWDRFQLAEIDASVIAALCVLLERSRPTAHARWHLPSFADTMVLAFGLAHGARVVSQEWEDKRDWDGVAGLFPELVVR